MKKGAKTKNEILAAAFRLASMKGLNGLTIGALATEVGMSKSGLFAHFRSKEKLQLQVLEWVSERFVEKVLTPSLKESRGEPRIRAFFQTWLYWHNRFAGPGGCIFISAASEYDDRPGVIRDFLFEQQAQLFSSIERMVQAAIEESHFHAKTDPKQFTYQYYSLFLGYHHFNRLIEDPAATTRLEQAFEDLLRSYTNERGTEHEHRANN